MPVGWLDQLPWRLGICPFRMRLPIPVQPRDWNLRHWPFVTLLWYLRNTTLQETSTQKKRPNHGQLEGKDDRVQDGQVLWPQLGRWHLGDSLKRTLLSCQLVVQFMIKTVIYVPFHPPNESKGFIVFEVFFSLAWDPCSLPGLSVVSMAWPWIGDFIHEVILFTSPQAPGV